VDGRRSQDPAEEVEAAAVLARLAREVADRLEGPEGLRLQGFADAFGANVLRVTGALPEADAAIEQAESRWKNGTDADGVLDPGRLLDLKASLRRDQRWFVEALKLLDEAVEVGQSPEIALIKKGFTLEVMGEFGRAVETLTRSRAPGVAPRRSAPVVHAALQPRRERQPPRPLCLRHGAGAPSERPG
jgi:tetratricopeptide (TPR) repeat protein